MQEEMEEKKQEEIKNETNNGDSDELSRVKEEREQYLNSWRRAEADLINYKNEETKRIEKLIKFGNEDILEELIRILDNFHRGLEAIAKSESKADEGIYMIKNQIADLLKKRGVIKIEVKPGMEFNPMYHEAIEMVDSDGELKSGHIVEEVEAGYTLHDKVLKPARVRVVN